MTHYTAYSLDVPSNELIIETGGDVPEVTGNGRT
jgi:hypothetical protein